MDPDCLSRISFGWVHTANGWVQRGNILQCSGSRCSVGGATVRGDMVNTHICWAHICFWVSPPPKPLNICLLICSTLKVARSMCLWIISHALHSYNQLQHQVKSQVKNIQWLSSQVWISITIIKEMRLKTNSFYNSANTAVWLTQEPLSPRKWPSRTI